MKKGLGNLGNAALLTSALVTAAGCDEKSNIENDIESVGTSRSEERLRVPFLNYDGMETMGDIVKLSKGILNIDILRALGGTGNAEKINEIVAISENGSVTFFGKRLTMSGDKITMMDGKDTVFLTHEKMVEMIEDYISTSNSDFDNDGIPDSLDRDIDGDGIINKEDNYPYNSNKS